MVEDKANLIHFGMIEQDVPQKLRLLVGEESYRVERLYAHQTNRKRGVANIV